MTAPTNECEHVWADVLDRKGLSTGEVRCEQCEASPRQVLATGDTLEMPCGHVLDEEHDLTEHINWGWIGEGTLKSCDPLMPGWSD